MPRYNGGFIGTDGLDAPDEPTIGTPSAGSTQADIAFTAPTDVGTSAITEYVATTNDGIGATGSSSPITITGLTNNTSYTARVYARNAYGTSAASAASASFTPLAEVISGLFQTTLWDGNGSTQTITNNIDLSNKGGLVWIKSRDQALVNGLFDTVRGKGSSFAYRILSDDTNAQSELADGLSAFNSNGFALGSSTAVNGNTYEYVGWTFREQPKFFDIVTYTGDGTNYRNISHNLGSVPGHVMVKKTSGGSVAGWINWHRTFSDYQSVFINTQEATYSGGSNGGVFGQASGFTTTQFQLGGPDNITYHNENNSTYVAYLFAHNDGDGGFGPDSEDIIKCGSYTGDGSSLNSVSLGFEPQWVMIKRTNSSASWYIFDVMRGMAMGDADFGLIPNSSNAEMSSQNWINPTATGFDLTNSNTNVNGNGDSYIYVAIRRPGMSTPTVASSVFSIDTKGSSAPYFDSNHIVDMALVKSAGASGDWYNYARHMGEKYLATNSTAAEANASEAGFDFMDGHIDSDWGGTDAHSWMWKRARGYFDVVAYSGNGSNRTITHNLDAVPEMMWVKSRSNASHWQVYHSALGNTKYMELNNDTPVSTNSARWNDTTPTSSVFTLGTDDSVNDSSRTYIAYLFATVAGVSKVGSYTGNAASDRVIDCGFTNGAKFVLIKDANSNGTNWQIFDTARGLTSTKAELLRLNLTNAQIPDGSPSQDYHNLIEPDSSGFKLNHTSALQVNANSITYIFYAIANDPS